MLKMSATGTSVLELLQYLISMILWLITLQSYHQVNSSLSQYTYHAAYDCYGNDRIAFNMEFQSAANTCEHLCSRYEPCVGFVLVDKVTQKECFIKYRCSPEPGQSTVELYVKTEATIIRSNDLMSKDALELYVNTDQYSYDITAYDSGSDLDCAFICLFSKVQCYGTIRSHDSHTVPGKCHTKSWIGSLTPLGYVNTVWVHSNPLLPFYDILNSFTMFTSQICSYGISEHDITQINFLHEYLCAEQCWLTHDCVGFAIDVSLGICIMKSTCNPDELQTNSNFNTYIMKRKSICSELGPCYTVILNKVLNYSDSLAACSSLDQQVLALETEEEFASFQKLLRDSSFAWMNAPVWTSLDLGSNSWKLSDSSAAALTWNIPWENGLPVNSLSYVMLNQTLGEFVNNDGSSTVYAVCESETAFTVYGTGEASYTNTLSDRNSSTCFSSGQRYLGSTVEVLSSGSNTGGVIVYVYGKNMNKESPGFALMFAKTFSSTLDGRHVKTASYGHCAWMYETHRESNIQEWVFHCKCGQNCSKVFLKVYQQVELCEVWAL